MTAYFWLTTSARPAGTGTGIIEGLLKRGVKIAGFAVLFDKVFQGGLEEVAKLGIKVYSCIHVLDIGKHDAVVIAP